MCGDGEAISLTRTCVSESGFKELGVIIDSLDSFRYLVHYFDNVPTQIRHRNLNFFLSFFCLSLILCTIVVCTVQMEFGRVAE